MHNQQIQETGSQSSFHNANINLSGKDFERVAIFIGDYVGIQLPESKHTLVEGRLRKRLRRLGLAGFNAYLDYALDSTDGENERLHLIDAITTNKTDFFREPEHFTYLARQALPEMERNRIRDGRPELGIWSAGCSTGEEPYTLSMVMQEAAERTPALKFRILATDISQSCLETARRGIYTEKHVEPVPLELRRKYLLKSRKSADSLVCIGPEMKSKVHFGVLNLMDKQFSLTKKMDAIFCRNVMIYFNKDIREELVDKFDKQLVSGGYLFVGHSESLNGLKNRLKQVAPMVYKKP